MRLRAVLLGVTMALVGESIAFAAPSSTADSTEAGDRRGRIGGRANDRLNDRATPRTTSHWTNPLARTRTREARTASTVSDAITYNREYRPR